MKSKRIAAIVAGVLVSGAVFGVASATEHEPTDVYGGGDDDAVLVEYDESTGTLTLSIRGEDGFPDCTEAGGEEPVDGCFVVTVDGDAETLNHGKFVSAVARALHPSLLPDGMKKGHIMRVVAKSKLGKDSKATDDEITEGDADLADADKAADKAARKAERDAAKAERKAEREAAKADRKANKKTGPPDHAKAKGKRSNG